MTWVQACLLKTKDTSIKGVEKSQAEQIAIAVTDS